MTDLSLGIRKPEERQRLEQTTDIFIKVSIHRGFTIDPIVLTSSKMIGLDLS